MKAQDSNIYVNLLKEENFLGILQRHPQILDAYIRLLETNDKLWGMYLAGLILCCDQELSEKIVKKCDDHTNCTSLLE